MPRLAVVGPVNSAFNAFTPCPYFCRATALVKRFGRVMAMMSPLPLPVLALAHPHSPHTASPLLGEVIRKDVDEPLHQVHGRGERQIRDRVIMDLPVICHAHVPHEHVAVDLDLISCPYHDVMTRVVRFAHTLHRAVPMFLSSLGVRSVLHDMPGRRLRGRGRASSRRR